MYLDASAAIISVDKLSDYSLSPSHPIGRFKSMTYAAPRHVLPDVVRRDLRAVICGTAAGVESAARGVFYANPGNKFWGVLKDVGLTQRKLAPEEFQRLPEFGLGLTDIAKLVAGTDMTLSRDAFDVLGFVATVRRYRPVIVAFNGKKAAQ